MAAARSQQQFMPFDRYEISHAEDHRRLRLALGRSKHFRIDAVVQNGCIHPSAGALDYLTADFLTHANNRAGGTIHGLRNPDAPLPGIAAHLPGRKGIQPVDRDHERYFQLPAEQRSGVAARQGGMGMDHVHRMLLMQPPDLRQKAGEKKSPRTGQAPAAGKRKKTHAARRNRLVVDRHPAPVERLCRPNRVGHAQPGQPGQRFRHKAALGIVASYGIKRGQSQDVKHFPGRRLFRCGTVGNHAARAAVFRDIRSRNTSSQRRVMGPQSNRSLCLRPASPNLRRWSACKSNSCSPAKSSSSEAAR